MTRPDEHPWSRTSTFEELRARWRQGDVPGRVRLLFLSPTAFAGRDASTLFPLPALVFGSLVRRWNQHAPEPFAPSVRDSLLGTIREEAHELHTFPIEFGTHRLKGFVGVCEYSAHQGAPAEVSRVVQTLADFAFYSGVGLTTTMGMGQVICEQQ